MVIFSMGLRSSTQHGRSAAGRSLDAWRCGASRVLSRRLRDDDDTLNCDCCVHCGNFKPTNSDFRWARIYKDHTLYNRFYKQNQKFYHNKHLTWTYEKPCSKMPKTEKNILQYTVKLRLLPQWPQTLPLPPLLLFASTE